MLSRAEIALVWRLFQHDAARNRKRIALTVLAIAWGTLSIVLLLSFGEGLKRAFHAGKSGMGEGIGVLWPGSTTRAYMGLPSGRTLSFTDEDADILKGRIPTIASVSREYATYCPVAVGTKLVNARTRGVDPAFGDLRNIIPRSGGRFIDELDLDAKRRVVVLGDGLATDLFGDADPVGKTVRINQSSFLVIGVMQTKVMMGMYSGPDKNQATHPGLDVQVDVHGPEGPELRLQAGLDGAGRRGEGRDLPGAREASTGSTPKTRARSASGTRARTSGSWATSPSASRCSSGSSARSRCSWGGWASPTSCTRW